MMFAQFLATKDLARSMDDQQIQRTVPAGRSRRCYCPEAMEFR